MIQIGPRTSKLVVRNDAQAEILKNDIKKQEGTFFGLSNHSTENEAIFNRIHLI
jgi:hypothetical protein